MRDSPAPLFQTSDVPGPRQRWRRWVRRLTGVAWALGVAGVALAEGPLITEFAAANNAGLRDEDGDYCDWIEIYNPEAQPVSLAGWFLTDQADALTRWPFPDVSVPGQSYLVVFASEKDRRDPLGSLHTNFKLDAAGEYLALVRPDGLTVASAFAPVYPGQRSDVSYGFAMTTQTEEWVSPEGPARLWVPTDGALGGAWTLPGFADGDWAVVPMGIGYDRPPGPGDPVEPGEPLADVTQAGDFIVPTSENSPGGEGVGNAIDDNPATKYLNFDKLNAGMTVTPATGPTVVTGLRLTSANDAPDRDPTSYILLGSDNGLVFTEIARGGLPDFTSRFFAVAVSFANLQAYKHYRLLFPTVRDAAAAVAMQIAEVEFLGRAGPTAPSFPDLIQTHVESQMFGRASSAYLRFPFTVQEVVTGRQLVLGIRYDDGFVAWLNGVEVARANAPQTPTFDAVALTNRYRFNAVQEARFNLSAHWNLVHPGTNVLAVQILNDRATSPDFLAQVRLESSGTTLGNPAYFDAPTPGRDNAQGGVGLISEVVLSPARGFADTPFDLTMACATEGVLFRYTTDGSVPTATHGARYVGPVRIGRTTTVRAAAFKEGWLPSRTTTHTYLFLDDIVNQSHASTVASGFPTNWAGQTADYGLDPRVVGPAGQDNYGGKYTRTLRDDLRALPSLCLGMDLDDLFGAQGIYAYPESRGDAWERPVSVEWIDPNAAAGFQENAGVRIQGGAFRRFDLTLKKSFRLVFREKYGNTELRFPFFGPEATDRFDTFVLRANSNDAWPYFSGRSLYIRDAFAMESARAMGRVASHTTFVHLYLNGVYWGLYNPVERPDAAFSATYFGGDKDTWDALNQDSVPDGTADAWNRMLALLDQDVSRNEVYQRLQGNNPDGTRNPAFEDLVDVESLIDYMILNLYVGNGDWPGRNWWVGRNRDDGDGFKFYPWDTETALGVTGLDANVTGVSGAVARPYAALRANADFRMWFADRAYRHFSPGGALYVNPASPAYDPAHPENNRPAARLADLAARVRRALVGESARWGDQRGTGPFTPDENWLPERDNLLANFFPQRSAIVLNQFRQAGLYPQLDPPQMSQSGGSVPVGYALSLSSGQGMIYYTTNGADPRAPVTIELLSRLTLVTNVAPARVLIPSVANGGASLGASWRGGAEPFDDSSWQAGAGAVGYDSATDYLGYIGIDVRTPMAGVNGSAFVRIPFDCDAAGLGRWNFMTLRARYDDGFVAYLNGVRVTGANDPADPQWNSVAVAQHDDAAAVVFQDFKVDDGLAALKAGRNILALQGLNLSLGSSDLLLGVELVAGERRVTTGTNSALLYSTPLVLNDLTTVKARTFDGLEWSALHEATFLVGTPTLAVTEVHYHPAAPSEAERAAGFTDAGQFEFIEFFNGGTGTFQLDGVRLTAGVEFDFTGSAVTRLPAGGYVLVVKNRAAFELRYGPGLPIAGEFNGQLNNGGERITVAGSANEILVDFVYGNWPPWPTAPDGAGPSLEVGDPGGDRSLPGTWKTSAVSGGSPGAANALPPLVVHVVSLQDAQLQLWFPGRAGLGYTVYSKDAATDAWQVVQHGDPLPQDQPVDLALEVSPEAHARFFRVSIP